MDRALFNPLFKDCFEKDFGNPCSSNEVMERALFKDCFDDDFGNDGDNGVEHSLAVVEMTEEGS